jgi:tRNA (cytidine/uridine-2'-O-)-methyltransferase
MGVALEVIEPCAFPLSDKALRRAALDYGGEAAIIRHASWSKFQANRQASGAAAGRLVLFTTRSAQPFQAFAFHPDDSLVFGQESAGAPEAVHEAADARLLIPIRSETRSLNVAAAAAMALSEALRQTGGLDALSPRRHSDEVEGAAGSPF